MIFTRLLTVAGLALLPGCADMLNPPTDPDAMPMVDAGIPDAVPIDAPPPWEPPEPVIPGEPCEIVSEVPEAMYDAGMANYAVRFSNGQGLEDSPDIRQTGALVVRDAHLDNREVIEKRRGADVLADTTDSEDLSLDDRRAIWTRGDEVLLETHDAIYREQRAVTDSQWARVASWTRMRLREAYAGAFAFDVTTAEHAVLDGGESTVVAYQDDATDVWFAVYGPSLAQDLLTRVSSFGVRPRLSSLGPSSVFLTRQNSVAPFQLLATRYDAGDSGFSLGTTPVAAMAAAGDPWDVHGVLTEDAADEVTAWVAAAPTAAEMEVQLRIGAVTGSRTFAAEVSNLADVAIAIWPRRVPNDDITVFVVSAFNNAGTWTLRLAWINFDAATGAFVNQSGGTFALTDTANPVHSVAVSWTDRLNNYIAVEQDTAGATRKVSYYTAQRGVSFVDTGIVHESTALMTQGAIVAGTPSDTLVSAGAAPLSAGFTEQLLSGATGTTPYPDEVARSGWVVFVPRTGEVVSRSFVAYTGTTRTRTARPAKGSFIAEGDSITWAGAVSLQSEPFTEAMRAIAICKLDRAQYPNAPAFADGSVVSAHAGYPRAYDGTSAFEHDWHTTPLIDTAPTQVASADTTTNGNHFFAVTFESDDANGLRYRSAPFFFPGPQTIGGVNQSYNVPVEAFTHTERTNVRYVVWMTVADGTSFHRAAEFTPTGAAQSLVFAITDTDLAEQEVLDQAPAPAGQGVIPSSPARVTDFMAWTVDRLMSRDPLKGSLARFSIPSREASGYAMHWPLAFAVEEPDEREITAALEMDGRTVLGSRLGLALLNGDGPDATGAGSYGQPVILRAEIGIADQAQLARTPIGYAFGSIHGPRLLTPGLTVEQLDRQVERQYKIDGGTLVAVSFDQNREEIVWLSPEAEIADETFRLHTGTGRWASDPERTGRDITVTKSGTVYMIRYDGKVLKQREDVYSDGDGTGGAAGFTIPYALTVSTPWIRDQTRDGTTHSNFRVDGIYISGEYVGPHALYFDLYRDYNETEPYKTFEVSAATIAENQAAGLPYIYGVRIGGTDSFYALRVVVRDGEEQNATFRLAQMDIQIQTDKNSGYVALPLAQLAQPV